MGERVSKPSVSVIIPACNEAASLKTTIDELARVLGRMDVPYEVVIVDDGSTDETTAVCRDLSSSITWVRTVTHARHEGYGRAVWTGITNSRHDVIVLLPADLQYDFDEVPRLVSLTDEHDIVVGRRVKRADPLLRRMNARCWSALVRALCDVPVHDINSGFKAYRRSAVAGLEIKATGASIDAEILARAYRRGARVLETPVHHRPRRFGRATGGRPSVIARGLYELCTVLPELRSRV